MARIMVGPLFIYLFFPNRKIIYDALDNGPNQFKLIKFKLFLSNKTQQKRSMGQISMNHGGTQIWVIMEALRMYSSI